MADDEDVADAESFEDEEEEEEEDDEEEEDLLFGKLPRTPTFIVFGVLVVVILLLLAALISNSFGLRSGITSLTVNVPNSEGGILDEKLYIEAYTGTPAFGKNAEGNGDLTIYWEDQEIFTTKFKFTDARGSKSIPYEDFYVDNGEYKVEIKFEGKTESDTITLERTVHNVAIIQLEHIFEEEERVRYQITYYANEIGTQDILVPGHGKIELYYIENEGDKDDESEWENVTTVEIWTTFTTFTYQFQGEAKKELSASTDWFYIDIPSSKLTDEKGEGWYSARVYYTNDYGLTDYGAFRGWVDAMPEDIYNSETGKYDSNTWVKLGDEEE